jgi:hypothetical protein
MILLFFCPFKLGSFSYILPVYVTLFMIFQLLTTKKKRLSAMVICSPIVVSVVYTW